MAIKILIADDHPLIAEGLQNTFLNQSEFEVVGMASNGKQALEIINTKLVDVALLDINMPEMDGIECAKAILKEYPEVKVAILSMYQETSLIKNLIKIGVKGYMIKTIPSEELIMAIKKIYNGKEYYTAEVTKAIIDNKNSENTFITFSKKSPLVQELTPREKEIIKSVSKGLTNPQIGEKLFISPRTVDTHRTNIMRKLNVHNVASLIRFAFQNGLT